MKTRGSLVIVLSVVLVTAGSSNTAAGDGPDPCRFRPWNSTDNGMGAESGVTREFDTGMSVHPDCLSNGRVFVPLVDIGLTRTAAGPSTLDLDVFVREAQIGNGLPGPFRTPTNMVTANGITQFPITEVFEFPTTPPGNSNIQNVLWGDYFYLGAAWSGDTQNVFIAVDQTGTPGETPCFTGINGAVPKDNCLNGNPNINSTAMGATGYTFYGRYTNGDFVAGDNREPLPTIWGARYLSRGKNELGSVRNLRIRDGRGGPVVCEYLNIPADFGFDCVMTPEQAARHDNGDVFAELEIGGVSEEIRVYPAGVLIFVDFFESGDTGVWSLTTP